MKKTGIIEKTAALALVTLLFLQHLRVFVLTVIWNLSKYLGAIENLAIYALAVIGAILLLPLLKKAAGGPRLFLLSGSLVITASAAMQFVRHPLAVNILAAFGVIMYLWMFILWITSAEGGEKPAAAPALLLAVLFDYTLRTLLYGYDIIWRKTAVTVPLMLLLCVLSFILLLRLYRQTVDGNAAPDKPGWRIIGFGPWFFLSVIYYQSLPALAQASGISDSPAILIGASSAAAGFAVFIFTPEEKRRKLNFAAGAALLLFTALVMFRVPLTPLWSWFGGFSLFAAAGIFSAGYGSKPETGGKTKVWITSLFMFFSWVLFIVLVMVDGLFKLQQISLLAAVVLLLTAIPFRAAAPGTAIPNRLRKTAIASVALLLALSLIWSVIASRPLDSAPPKEGPWVKIMTYNIHQGLDADYRADMEGIYEAIAAEDPDIICLQEANRAQISNGMIDNLAYLRLHLQLPYVYGANLGNGQYGNALFSRYPIISSENHLYENNSDEPRGVLEVKIEIPGGDLNMFVNHLDYLPSPHDVRTPQAKETLAFWGNKDRSILCGDFNADPRAPELMPLYDSRLIEVSDVLGLNGTPTFFEGYGEPAMHLDYIFLTPDLEFRNTEIIETRASDHKPVVTEVRIKTAAR